MSEYKIPIIPNLNLEKNENEHYEFNIDIGKIKSKKTGQTSEIHNLKIEIHDNSDINFEIDRSDYHNLFIEEVTSDDSRNFNQYEIRFFDIECDSNKYNIYLVNFRSKNSTYKSKNSLIMSILGECSECILVKNNNLIKNNDNVRVWNILECSNTSHVNFLEFKSNDLSNIFLKSKNTHDYDNENCDNLEAIFNLQEKQNNSFNQLLGEDSFLYYEDSYGKISNEIIDNIDKLLMFYDSSIDPFRFVIFESMDAKKLEIRIKSKNNYKSNGKSIFENLPNNLFDFINSSYDSYINLKNSDIDIDLLLYYYVWMKNEQYAEVILILCSEFLEVLKNNKFKPNKNERHKFYDKIFHRFSIFKLDTFKLLKNLQPEIFQLITELEREYINQGYNKKDVIEICNRYKKEYLLRCIERYRNKIIHSGKFELHQEDIDKIIEKLMKDFKTKYDLDSQIELIEKIGEDLKSKLYDIDSIFDVFKQSILFENVIEIFLLNSLNVDCLLRNNPILKSESSSWNDFNSKKYVDNFIKK